MRKVLKKRGVSPIVATTLLIAIVVILAVIIFLWARGFISEKVQKFDRAIDLACDDVNFEAGIAVGNTGNYELDVINRGNVPLYGFDVKILGKGQVLVNEILDSTVTIGDGATISLENTDVAGGDDLLVVPIILGESEKGKVAHTCPDQFGFATGII